MEREEIRKIVSRECRLKKLKEEVIEAIIQVESGWKDKIARYEKRFVYTHKVDFFAKIHKITPETENMFQKCSWGLMQIMGGTARDLGFSGWIPDLWEPEHNIYWGCEFYKKNCARYINVDDQIAAYNAGAVKRLADGTYLNQSYVDKVMELIMLSG